MLNNESKIKNESQVKKESRGTIFIVIYLMKIIKMT